MDEEHYLDDHSIPGNASLWRRIPPRHFTTDEDTGRLRSSSAAFEDHPNGSPMSVVLGDEVIAAGRCPASVIVGHDDYGVASLTAAFVRALGQGVVREQLENEPAHAVVFGRKTKSVRSKMAKGSTWVIAPEYRESSAPDSAAMIVASADDRSRAGNRSMLVVCLTVGVLLILLVAIFFLRNLK